MAKSQDLLSIYYNDVHKYDVLTQDEQLDLIKKAQEGDIAARDNLINCNLRLVIRIVSKINHGYVNLDLIQDGNVGLIEAIERFDPSVGCKFSTYAAWYIKKEVLEGKNKFTTVKYSNKFLVLWTKYKKLKKILVDTKKSFNKESLAKNLNVSLDFVNMLENAELMESKLSIEEPANKDETEKRKVGDILQSDFGNPESILIKNDTKKTVEDLLNDILDSREKDIIKKYYGFDKDPMTLTAIGQEYNITKERVRQIKEKSIKKIRSSSSVRNII